MGRIFESHTGPFLTLPLAVVLGLLAADVFRTLHVYRRVCSQKPKSSPGYSLGLITGAWHRTVLLGVAGALALCGSRIAVILFSVGILWRALGPGREVTNGFLAGYRAATGQLNPVLASAVGAAWVLISRGIPVVVLLYVSWVHDRRLDPLRSPSLWHRLAGLMSWKGLAVGAGMSFLLFYAFAVWSYLKGEGRERLESAVKALLTIKKNGGTLEIERRGRGVILAFCRQNGEMNWADLRLRIPLAVWSLPRCAELKQTFDSGGYEFREITGSGEWIGEVQIAVEDIWAVGSATKAAQAANLALDLLGYDKDSRFLLRLKGKMNWQRHLGDYGKQST